MARPRLHDDGYLAYLRDLACVACGRGPRSEAAHIRINFFALGKKPDDKFAVPLCMTCHRDQHTKNESGWWEARGMDPFAIAERLYAAYGGTGGAPRKRKPRQTIVPRGFGAKPVFDIKWPKRKIRNRGFNRVKSV